MIKTLEFRGGEAAADLLAAVDILRELYVRGGRNVPAGAPTSFVPARWQGYLSAAEEGKNTVVYRHYWELCVLLALRDALRSGEVWVLGSRRYADPTTILMPSAEWELARAIPLFEQTLADRRRLLGEEHPDTLSSADSLAHAYESAGRLEQALPLFEQTLADCRRLLGAEHPLTKTLAANLQRARTATGGPPRQRRWWRTRAK